MFSGVVITKHSNLKLFNPKTGSNCSSHPWDQNKNPLVSSSKLISNRQQPKFRTFLSNLFCWIVRIWVIWDILFQLVKAVSCEIRLKFTAKVCSYVFSGGFTPVTEPDTLCRRLPFRKCCVLGIWYCLHMMTSSHWAFTLAWWHVKKALCYWPTFERFIPNVCMCL